MKQEHEILAALILNSGSKNKSPGVTGITALWNQNVYRLSSVINRLRKKGIDIETTMIKGKPGQMQKKYARYKLAGYNNELDAVKNIEYKSLRKELIICMTKNCEDNFLSMFLNIHLRIDATRMYPNLFL